MLILAMESSAKAVSACLWQDGEILAQSYQRGALTHSRTLLPMVEDMLKNTATDKHSVDAVAVAHGPGSFTGIRIGISTAKGLCWGLGRPAVGVSTLEAMAFTAPVPDGETVICPCMDARCSQLYNALFEIRSGVPCCFTPDRAVAADELAAELARLRRRVWLTGDGWAIAAQAFSAAGVVYDLAPEPFRWQSAAGVAAAAALRTPQPAEELLPVYLRLSQAERERQKK